MTFVLKEKGKVTVDGEELFLEMREDYFFPLRKQMTTTTPRMEVWKVKWKAKEVIITILLMEGEWRGKVGDWKRA